MNTKYEVNPNYDQSQFTMQNLRNSIWIIAAVFGTHCVAQNTQDDLVPHAKLFEPNRLVEVKIEMAPADWKALRSQTRAMCMAIRKPAPPTPFTYFKADVTIDGQRIESVGIRKKGFVGSLDQRFPSLKIKFDKYVEQDPLNGLGRLTLNNNKQDQTVISQFMAYRLFAKADLPAPRCNFARVTVNDQYLGIYSNVESVKKPFLNRSFGNSNGKLYEGTLADFFVDRIDDFELKIGDDDNRNELTAVANCLAEEPCDLQTLEQHLDIDQFLRYWAMESLLNFWDGYTNNQNNFFVYHDPTDSKFRFIPWGADAVCQSAQFVPSEHKSVQLKSQLARRLYQTEGIADRYRKALQDLLDTVWDEPSLLAEIDRLENQLKKHMHSRQRRFTKAIRAPRTFIKNRRRRLEAEMETWPLRAKGRALKPTYTNSVGTVTGTFSADWLDKSPKSAYEVGQAELKMQLEGESVEFIELGAYGTTDRDKTGEKVRTILFVGKRKSSRMKILVRAGMSEDRFDSASSEMPVVVQGNLEEGGFGLFGILSTQGVRLVGGTLTVTGNDEGAVAGSVNLDVLRFVEDKRTPPKPD